MPRRPLPMVPIGVCCAMVRAVPARSAHTPAGWRAGRRPRRLPVVDDVDRALEQRIVALLGARADGASICPSEAARSVDPEGWRDLMPAARAAAGRLAAGGEVEVTQRGAVVDVATARGPVR